MKVLGIEFARPTFKKAFFLLLSSLIVAGFIYGIKISIDDGSITNKPEILRQIIFWPFSLALALRYADAFGLSRNPFIKKLLMIFIFYIPVGLVLAAIAW